MLTNDYDDGEMIKIILKGLPKEELRAIMIAHSQKTSYVCNLGGRKFIAVNTRHNGRVISKHGDWLYGEYSAT